MMCILCTFFILFCVMKWTDEHNILLCREVLLLKPYTFKSGTKESGSAWSSVACNLNTVIEVTFNVSQKSVRDRTKLLIDKFKRRTREEENSSGTVVEPTEIDMLLTDIKSETEEAAEKYDSLNTKQKELEKSSRENAEVIRTVAIWKTFLIQEREKAWMVMTAPHPVMAVIQ